MAIGLLLCVVIALPLEQAQSRESNRTLKLHFGHTGERGTFTFKRNGRYDRKELERINHFLRDWRKEEATRMDPQLLDLVWEIYQESGSNDYIQVVSAYRSPKTNAALRKRSSGVAKKSQHIRGKAMDFAIPDVPLDKLRAIAMKKQGGGVGYYPKSGFPFVHVDTGSVRAWPRMSRKQLIALFPKGETLHLPPDGKPLPGYERAVARQQSASSPTLAYLETEPNDADTDRTGTRERGGVRAWLKRVFPGNGEEDEDAQEGEEAAPSQTGEQLIAEADAPLEPRRPRPRPQTETAVAAVEALPAPATVAPDDARMIATLAYTPVPRSRPDPVFLAASLDDDQTGASTLPADVGSTDATAATSSRIAPERTPAANDPVALAFAAAEEAHQSPSADDRTAIAAFAAMRAQATPPAAEQMQQRTIAASATSPASDAPEGSAGTGGPSEGVVLAPDATPGYSDDREALRGLIATPATYDPHFARLEMPMPASNPSIYRAPDTAEALPHLGGGGPSLPGDRFAKGEDHEPARDERGFFLRLFASLIE